jgi:hypothetical protein
MNPNPSNCLCHCGCGSSGSNGSSGSCGRNNQPGTIANRPGLRSIAYRAGTHASFYADMLAALSGQEAGALAALHTRQRDDPAVALLDAWAVVADVLSFYNQRIANEAYLRTATERRSVLELARLTGYRLRPGVAASVYLAYQIDGNAAPLTIPPGSRSQSVPGPGEQMQTFETAEPLAARSRWNQIKPRLSQPQLRNQANIVGQFLYLQGLTTRLAVNDALLVRFGEKDDALQPYRVDSMTLEPDAGRTRISLRAWHGEPGIAAAAAQASGLSTQAFGGLLNQLAQAPNVQPGNALRLKRDLTQAFAGGADVYPQLLQRLRPGLETNLYAALVNAPVAPPVPVQVYALRVAAPLFAHNAAHQPRPGRENVMLAAVNDYVDPNIANTWRDLALPDVRAEGVPVLALDRVYAGIRAETASSYALIDRPAVDTPRSEEGGRVLDAAVTLHRVSAIRTATMSTPAGAALEVTQLQVKDPWLRELREFADDIVKSTPILRGTRVYAQSELLELAEEPLDAALCDHDGAAQEIELDGLYDGLQPGRWMFLSGERSDMDGVHHVPATELVMLSAVRNGVRLQPIAHGSGADAEPQPPEIAQPLPGERVHTFITLARPLAYCYQRASVTLQANVVRATHGETRQEVLGGGDPRQRFQQLALKQGPLTYLAAATETGADSTLALRVNGLLWHEHVALAADGPHSRVYVSRRDDAGQTSVIFGDGQHGQRPTGGADNIRAVYRSGIGSGGNVGAGQITLTTDKPLGVASVNNPLRAAGGADADQLEQARRNAPLAVMALGRLVGVRDYADFARAFAGIGKASAVLNTGKARHGVTVTIAGIDDQPIDQNADLFRNLRTAMRQLGDPQLPLRLQLRIALALTVSARVALLPDYAWEEVAPRLRAALYQACGFAQREIGQAVVESAIIGVIHQVRGVRHVVLQVRVYDQEQLAQGLTPAAPTGVQRIAPDQIAYLTPEVPDALILELLP